MQRGLNTDEIRSRIRKATRWQDHARLLFEVLHTPAKEDIQILASLYRAELKTAPSPLIRWAYANASIETRDCNINENPAYGIRPSDFWSDEQIFDELRLVTKEAPKEVMGYLGLARAYRNGLMDAQIVEYYKVLKDEERIVEINGRKQQVRYLKVTNPERKRRFRYYEEQVRKLDPLNPYLSYWKADRLYSDLCVVMGNSGLNYPPHEVEALKKRGKVAIAREGLALSKQAYENGFRYFSPIVALGIIIAFAWHAERQGEAKQWGDELKPWIAQNRESPYVAWLRMAYGHRCPYILELIR